MKYYRASNIEFSAETFPSSASFLFFNIRQNQTFGGSKKDSVHTELSIKSSFKHVDGQTRDLILLC